MKIIGYLIGIGSCVYLMNKIGVDNVIAIIFLITGMLIINIRKDEVD